MIEVHDLAVAYGPVRALDGVSLRVDAGETVAVLGANGAGKTSLLRAISGLVRPVRGEVRLDGAPITGLPPEEIVRRGIAHVPEGRRVFGQLTVAENLELASAPWRRHGGGLAEPLGRVHALFPVLDERRGQRGFSLSGGEQQMLAIGRALMAKPRVLLLDEPSLGLAPTLVERVFAALGEIARQGTTLLIVEQNVHQALKTADRAYVLAQGRVVLEGPAEAIRDDARVSHAYLGG